MTLNWASNQTRQRAWTWTDPPGLIRGIRKRFWAVKEPTHRQCEKVAENHQLIVYQSGSHSALSRQLFQRNTSKKPQYSCSAEVNMTEHLAAEEIFPTGAGGDQKQSRKRISHTRLQIKYVWSCWFEPAGHGSLWLSYQLKCTLC